MNRVTLPDESKVFFTSDQHFDHRNVIRFNNRPFDDVKEMNDYLIDQWNDVVGPDDHIFVLGDFFWFSNHKAIRKIIRDLEGHIYLVPGNHDKPEAFDKSDVTVLDSISTLFTRGLEIVMSHYPLLTWTHKNWDNSINLFGHIHSKGWPYREFDERLVTALGKQLDVGVDAHAFSPISLDQVLEELSAQTTPRPR